MIVLGQLPEQAQAAIVEAVETAIGSRSLPHFGTIVDRDLDLAAWIVRRLRDYGADWEMAGDHLLVKGWTDVRMETT